MRLKAEIFIKAVIRTLNGQGAMAAVVKHGDDDAGAIWVKVATLDGRAALFGPAPAGMDAASQDRRFTAVLPPVTPEATVDERLARERRFDSDIWIIEVEDRHGRHGLEPWLVGD